MRYISKPDCIIAEDESGRLMAEVTFPEYQEGVVCIDHTYVDPSLRGQGIASELMRRAYGQIKSDGKRARATCPYAVTWFARHPQARDILE